MTGKSIAIAGFAGLLVLIVFWIGVSVVVYLQTGSIVINLPLGISLFLISHALVSTTTGWILLRSQRNQSPG